MKMFRPALAGVLPAFVLFVCIQLNARVASTPPPDMHSWFTGDDTVNNHIWQPAGRLYNGATYAAAKIAAPSQSSQLFFEDRVAYQRAIEEVYWRHRLWPKERPDRKPSLDAVMSQATIEKKVEDYLRNSELLEHSWQKPITPEQLQAEMERMAQDSKQPEVLRELFAALGNDPFVIAECLARPVLSERFANGDPVAAGVPPAHPSRMPPQKPFLAGWLAKAETRVPVTMAAANASYTLPVISDQPSGCIDDRWTATTMSGAPARRYRHTAVWTGSEMIVWGGLGVLDTNLNTGGRYNPSTDSWTATSTTNAPDGRWLHTAVWTGSEMIVWGGFNGSYLNTGGRYNPGTDSWTATSTTNAPTVRGFHTAVLTSSEMIVWGGINNMPPDPVGRLNTGGRYCAQASGPITLSAAKRKVGGINTVRLTWSGATSTDIDVYRDGVVIVTTANDGSYTDSTGDTGRAQYTYRVCEAGTSTCSNNAIVTFPH